MRRLVALLALVLSTAGAQAQPFTVVSSVPADYAVGVPLQTTLSLTFSRAVYNYPEAGSSPALVLLPAGAGAVYVFPSRSADGLTLTFALTLQPDTRYVALLLSANAGVGATGLLARAFAVNFTTAASNGPLTVRGNVAGVDGIAPDGSIVALVTGDEATGNVRIVAADIVEGGAASLPYVLGPVPLGLYTAAAILLPIAPSFPQTYGYGLHDPDGDRTPNPIFATTGVDIALGLPPPRTAGAGFAEVQAAALGATGRASGLMSIRTATVDLAAAAPVWSYLFRGGGGCGERVNVLRLGLFVIPVASATDFCSASSVSFLTLDSDAALRSADRSRGDAFRAAHPGEGVRVEMRLVAVGSGTAIWYVEYTASGGSRATVEVPFVVSAVGGGPAATARRLVVRSANPARGAFEASLTLDAPAEARVTVMDAQGRTVAVLLDGPLGAGAHAVRWSPAPALAAGVYWLRAEAAGRTEAVAVTRVR